MLNHAEKIERKKLCAQIFNVHTFVKCCAAKCFKGQLKPILKTTDEELPKNDYDRLEDFKFSRSHRDCFELKKRSESRDDE